MFDAELDTEEVVGRIGRVKAGSLAARRGLAQYAFAITDGEVDGSPAFHVVTESGERVALTLEMAKGLEGLTTCIAGSTVALIDALESSGELGLVTRLRLTLAISPKFVSRVDYVDLESTLTPDSLGLTRLTVTTNRRPAAWPR